MDREAKFLQWADNWKVAKQLLDYCAEEYRAAHAKQYLNATGPDAARKAAADAATSELRKERDSAERIERHAYHTLVFYRGSAGEREERS